MRKVKNTVCFFNTIASWGGGEKWHFEMAKGMSERKYSVLFITKKGGVLFKKIKDENITMETVTVGKFSYLNVFKINRVVKILRDYNVKTIVLNSSSSMKFGSLAAKKACVPNIIYRRGSAIPIKNTFINRYFFQNVLTGVLANSPETKNTINRNNPNLFPEEKITVIPNGIDIVGFHKQDYNPYYLKKDNEFVWGNIGRCVYQKNQTFLLDVLYYLKNKGYKTKLIIGGDGKLLKNLKVKAHELELQNDVIFTGFVNNPKDLLMSIDVFSLSSHWEGFGYVLAEAMLCKKPCIAFDKSSNSQLVKNGYNGFLTNYQNVKEFADKLIYFMENTDKCNEMGLNGQQFIESYCNIEKIQDEVIDYLCSSK